MSYLRRDICSISPEVSRVLKQAQLHTDSDLRSLTREDLHELFPGSQSFKLRRTIFDKIHKEKPFDVLIRELKDFIPQESFRAALTNNGVLVEYLSKLRDMKTQMNYIHSFLDAHIGLLEELSKDQREQESDKDESNTSGQGVANAAHSGVHAQRSQDSYPGAGTGHVGQPTNTGPTAFPPREQTKVTYQTVVKGKTLGADQQLMGKVISFHPDLVRFECSDDGQIIIVFCPISSRIGSDVEVAMLDVTDDKPVILVLMFHSRQPTCVAPEKILHQYPKVKLLVSVFYHDTMNGLLTCKENNDAIYKIQQKLLEYSPQRSEDTSGNASGVSSPVQKNNSGYSIWRWS